MLLVVPRFERAKTIFLISPPLSLPSLTLSLSLSLAINFYQFQSGRARISRICNFYLYDRLAEDREVTRKIS